MAKENPPADFRLADNEGYILNRGHLAAARLNLQYFLWQRTLDFTIHKSIYIPSDAFIADVATGTALWPIDVSREHPTAQIHGFDIDLSQAPPKPWVPQGVTLRQWNVFEDPPNDMIGKYHLVHVRLLVLVLSGLDPRPVIRRLLRLLKPGGYLQWDDLDCVNMHIKRVDESLLTPALDELLNLSHSNGRHDWVMQLPELVAQEGFVDPKLHRYGDPWELARAFNEQHLMTMDEFASGLLKIGKSEAAANILRLVQEGYKESLQGAVICFPRVVCTARRQG